MTGLKDGRLLVTERKGKLQLFDPQTKQKTEVKGMPKVAYGGQGGLRISPCTLNLLRTISFT